MVSLMISNKIFEINEKGRDFVVGDIHGCYNQLESELNSVTFNGNLDRLFSVGDLIDKGPDSLKCLNLVNEPWFHCVRGNHEQFLVDCIHLKDDYQLNIWFYNGGNWINDYGKETPEIEEIISLAKKFDEEIPITMTVKTKFGTIGICHAEPPSDWDDVKTLTDRQAYALIWNRRVINKLMYEGTKNIDLTIHGHTPVKEYERVGNAMFIDTGSFLKHFNLEGYSGVKILRIDNILESN